jgi:hypothetical protein
MQKFYEDPAPGFKWMSFVFGCHDHYFSNGHTLIPARGNEAVTSSRECSGLAEPVDRRSEKAKRLKG